ncbi:MAG: signal peptidase I [Oligoflexia bacterium]|nr:signal peptidase I [Oligoflexia bacterium]
MARWGVRRQAIWREYVEGVIVAVLVALALRAFVISAYKIPSNSMIPTLRSGDVIFAWKLPYRVTFPFSKSNWIKPRIPARGAVMLFRYPDDPRLVFVKRVMGIPGDKVEVRGQTVIINDNPVASIPVDDPTELLRGVPFAESHALHRESTELGEHLVAFRKEVNRDGFGPTIVPAGLLFVLGDSRDAADDSRFWGMVPVENLEGRAFLVWLSFDWENRLWGTRIPTPRWGRIAQLID